MKRRKLLIGMGALTAGSAAAMGTGAFTHAQMGRDADVNVVTDPNGLIGLTPGNTADGVVSLSDSPGELQIDFSGLNEGGVNVNSVYRVGRIFGLSGMEQSGGPTTHPAFEVTNNDTATHSITLEYEFDDSSNVFEDGSWIGFNARPLGAEGTSVADGSGMPIKNAVANHDDPNPSLTYDDNDAIVSGGGFGVSILVDTTGEGASADENLSGTLTISAGDHSEMAE